MRGWWLVLLGAALCGSAAAAQLPFVLWQFNYHSGFNDKRTIWFYKVAETVRALQATLVLPYFNSLNKTDRITGEQFDPFEFYFDQRLFQTYVPCVTMTAFHQQEAGRVDLLLTPARLAWSRYHINCSVPAQRPDTLLAGSRPSTMSNETTLTVTLYQQKTLPWQVKQLICVDGSELGRVLAALRRGGTGGWCHSLILDGYDNQGGMEHHFSGYRDLRVLDEYTDVPDVAPFVQFSPALFAEASCILVMQRLRPVNWPAHSAVPQLPPANRPDSRWPPFYAIHWRWPKGANANVYTPPSRVGGAFLKALAQVPPTQPTGSNLTVWLAAAMARPDELAELTQLLKQGVRDMGFSLSLLTHESAARPDTFGNHEGLLVLLDQIMCALAELVLCSDRSTMSNVVKTMRKQMHISNQTFSVV